MTFRVIDPQTGERPDPFRCWSEDWAKDYLMPKKWCWFVTEDGDLGVEDSVSRTAYPPEGRFTVEFTEEER